MLLDVKNLAVSYAKNSKPTIEGVSFELARAAPARRLSSERF